MVRGGRRVRAGARSLRSDGLGATLARLRVFVGQRLLRVEPDFAQHRYLLGDHLGRELDFTVAAGPFTGLRLAPESWWSAADRGAMLVGLYEREVLDELVSASAGRSTLVDVGAADGYYAIGAVTSGLFDRAVCFELSAEGREVIARKAARNSVEDRVTILGEAGPDFLSEIPPTSWTGPKAAVFLFDIEGAEFTLLGDDQVRDLAGAVVIVELHDPAGTSAPQVERLIERSRSHFDVRIISTGARDPGAVPHLDGWSDDDRWLLCSESRAYLMRWLVLTPKG